MKIKNNSCLNLIYIEKVDTNKMGSIISLKISKFKNQVNDFITKNKIIYQIIYNSIITRLYNLNIIKNYSI